MPNLTSLEMQFTIKFPKLDPNGKMRRLNVLQVGNYLTKNDVTLMEIENPVFRNLGKN